MYLFIVVVDTSLFSHCTVMYVNCCVWYVCYVYAEHVWYYTFFTQFGIFYHMILCNTKKQHKSIIHVGMELIVKEIDAVFLQSSISNGGKLSGNMVAMRHRLQGTFLLFLVNLLFIFNLFLLVYFLF